MCGLRHVAFSRAIRIYLWTDISATRNKLIDVLSRSRPSSSNNPQMQCYHCLQLSHTHKRHALDWWQTTSILNLHTTLRTVVWFTAGDGLPGKHSISGWLIATLGVVTMTKNLVPILGRTASIHVTTLTELPSS